MLLKDYIPRLNKKHNNISFSGISFDSSKVLKKNIFFAIKGNKFDGNNYIDIAIKKGANIIVTEKRITKKKQNIVFLFSPNVRKLFSNCLICYWVLNSPLFFVLSIYNSNSGHVYNFVYTCM